MCPNPSPCVPTTGPSLPDPCFSALSPGGPDQLLRAGTLESLPNLLFSGTPSSLPQALSVPPARTQLTLQVPTLSTLSLANHTAHLLSLVPNLNLLTLFPLRLPVTS